MQTIALLARAALAAFRATIQEGSQKCGGYMRQDLVVVLRVSKYWIINFCQGVLNLPLK